jgi:hypothetical protein
MPQVSISEAARLTGKARSTIQRHVQQGKVSKGKDAGGNPVIDTSELERVYGPLQQRGSSIGHSIGQRAAPHEAGAGRGETEALKRENALLREQVDDLRKDRDHWRQQATALLTDRRQAGPRSFWSWLQGRKTA